MQTLEIFVSKIFMLRKVYKVFNLFKRVLKITSSI